MGKHRDKAQESSDWPLTLALMAVLLGGTFAGIAAWRYWSDRHLHARVAEVALTSHGVLGAVGISHSGKGHSSIDYRVSLVDVHSGALKAQQVLDLGQPHCAELAGNALWCRSRKELEALTLPDLQVRFDWKALQKQLPELAVGLDGDEGWLKHAGDQLLVGTNDGRQWLLGLDPPKATPADPAAVQAASELKQPGDFVYQTHSGNQLFDFGANQGRRQAVRVRPVYAKLADAVLGPDTYLKPAYLPLFGLDRLRRELADPPGALVVHHTSLESREARILVTRVDATGRAAWTRDLGQGHLELGVFEGDALVLVANLPDGTALGLDPTTGAVKWRTEF